MRKADGNIVISFNPMQAGDQPYCSTGGRLPWKAHRVP